MRRADFIVSYDPAKEDKSVLGKRIIQSLFYGRIKQKKPCIIFLGGDSGEGKSWAVLKIQEALLDYDGFILDDWVDHINVYTPLQYPDKLKKLLWDKDLKKLRILAIHEAREVVKAKLWYSFVNQAIADVNAMSRSVKRMVTIIVSQFIRDITNDMRYTLNFYITADRPRGEHTRLYINVLFKDDRDLEKPKLRKRRIFGYIRVGNKFIKYSPKYISVGLPPKQARDLFDEADRASKEEIIKRKLERIIKDIELDVGINDNKVAEMVKHYASHPENLNLIGRRYRGKFVVNSNFIQMHGLSKDDVKLFQDALGKALINKSLDLEEDYNG